MKEFNKNKIKLFKRIHFKYVLSISCEFLQVMTQSSFECVIIQNASSAIIFSLLSSATCK